MPFVDRIVNHINQQLLANALKDVKFSGSRLDGIALTIPEINMDKSIKWFPAIADDFDNHKSCEPDDIYPVQIYHKIISSPPQSTANEGNYGDGLKRVADSYNMQMIVYGNRERLRMNMYDMESLLVANIPTVLPQSMKTDLKLLQCTISVGDRSYDPFRIWVDEYRTLDNIGLKPSSLYFRINYRIEQKFDKSCYALCNC